LYVNQFFAMHLGWAFWGGGRARLPNKKVDFLNAINIHN
jgi:hypothetical protein